MPKNKGPGGKNRRKGKNLSEKTEITYKTNDQAYAQIVKSLGNGFMEVTCFMDEGPLVMRAHIRGKMRRKIWMAQGDIVLVSLRDFHEKTCDIILKYNLSEVKMLKSKKEIPDTIEIKETEDQIQFQEDESDTEINDL